jgi:hypothetical protein
MAQGRSGADTTGPEGTMNGRMVEGVIYCATHGKPPGECRHPVLEGEVPDAAKPVSQQQRLRGGHLRTFVTLERIDSNPRNGGIRGEGVPDAWARQQQLPIVCALPPRPLPDPSIYEQARRMVAEFDRAWVEENTRVPRDPLATGRAIDVNTHRVPERHNQWHRWDYTRYLGGGGGETGFQCRDCPAFVSQVELRDWDGDRFPDEPGRMLDAIVSRRDVRTEFVTTLEARMLRMTEDEERRVLDELHRRLDELHVPPFDPEAYMVKVAERTGITPFTPPKKWSWDWWCREWRFLTLRLRRWAIKRLGGDA